MFWSQHVFLTERVISVTLPLTSICHENNDWLSLNNHPITNMAAVEEFVQITDGTNFK